MTDTNPYASPAATLAQPQVNPLGTFIPNGRTVDGGRGFEWVKLGFKKLFAAPGPWYLGILALYGAIFIGSLIPFLNILVMLFSLVANPVIMAGFYAAGDAQARTGTFEIGIVFDGFRKRTGQLLAVGAIMLAATLIIMCVGFMLAGGMGLIAMVTHSNGTMPEGFVAKIMLAYLVVLLLFVPVAMAAWFAPALVLFHNLSPIEALQHSFNASLKNFLPFLAYGVLAFLLCLVAAIPLGLGLLVVIPALMAAMYPIYADIFLDTTGKAQV